MWAKLGAQIVIELIKFLPGLAHKTFLAIKEYFARKKKRKAAIKAAERVQDAVTPSDVRDSVDDLP